MVDFSEPLILILVVANIPIYLFFGWLAFDDKNSASVTFGDALKELIKMLLVPRLLRVLMGDDEDGSLSIAQILAWMVACGLVVYGEYCLIRHFFPLDSVH